MLSKRAFRFCIKLTLVTLVCNAFIHGFSVIFHLAAEFTFEITFCATLWNSMHRFLVSFKSFPIFCHRVTCVAVEYFPIVPACVISHINRSVGFIIANSTIVQLSLLFSCCLGFLWVRMFFFFMCSCASLLLPNVYLWNQKI